MGDPITRLWLRRIADVRCLRRGTRKYQVLPEWRQASEALAGPMGQTEYAALTREIAAGLPY